MHADERRGEEGISLSSPRSSASIRGSLYNLVSARDCIDQKLRMTRRISIFDVPKLISKQSVIPVAFR